MQDQPRRLRPWSLLAVVCALAVAGCPSGPDSTQSPAPTPTQEPAPAPTPTPTPIQDPTPSQDARPRPSPDAGASTPPTQAPKPPLGAPGQGDHCPAGTCAAGLTCVEYYGIAGPRGPKFTSCEIPCKGKAACPNGQKCVTVADGPGEVCRPTTP